MLRHILTLLAAAVPVASAQDGGQLYTLYCGACHGQDGKGATGGTFPPLAGSPWVNADAALPIKIVLHGLHGPVDVLGKSFNLEMPPQGAMLDDTQIAAILTYVRSSWGNTGGAVTPEAVQEIRANTERKEPWTQEEILALHPLPLTKTNLENLISRVYLGQWQDLPDFDKLQPENVEEEHTGIISVKQAHREDHFGIVWEGEFVAPASGAYVFHLDADDAGRVILADKEVARVSGHGPMDGSRASEGKITLDEGRHPIRIEYMEYLSNQSIALGWKGPGDKEWRWLSDEKGAKTQPGPSYPIEPTDGRTAIYRNFIAGTTPRAIGFGFPGGMNLAWSADHLAPELIWTGAFMDGGRHWTDRGMGPQRPAGENVVTLSGSPAFGGDGRFRGYKLDSAGNPTFIVTVGDQLLRDAWKPGSQGELLRHLTLDGNRSRDLLISDRLPLGGSGGASSLGDSLEIDGAPLVARDGTVLLTLQPGRAVTLRYRSK